MSDQDEFWMNVAEYEATKSNCRRLHVGAVVVTGNHCSLGHNSHAHGCAKDMPGACGSRHAEYNALYRFRCDGGTIYVTHMPCAACAIKIQAAGISRVVYRHPYRLTEGVEYLVENGIQVTHLAKDDASQSSIETSVFAVDRDS